MSEPNEVTRDTPTQFARKLAMAAMTRKAAGASEEVEITRNAKGDYQYRVSGVVGEDETIQAAANRVLDLALYYDEKLPLSHAQDFERRYSKHDQGKR